MSGAAFLQTLTPEQADAASRKLRTTVEHRPDGSIWRYVRCKWCKGASVKAMKRCQ